MPEIIPSTTTTSVINRLWPEQKPTIRGITRGGFSVGFAISRDHIPPLGGLVCYCSWLANVAEAIQRAAYDWSLRRPRSVALATTSLIMSALRSSIAPDRINESAASQRPTRSGARTTGFAAGLDGPRVAAAVDHLLSVGLLREAVLDLPLTRNRNAAPAIKGDQ